MFIFQFRIWMVSHGKSVARWFWREIEIIRRWILLGFSTCRPKQKTCCTFCCLYTNQLATYQSNSKTLQATYHCNKPGPTTTIFLKKVSLHWKFFSDAIKADNTGIKQLNFINIHICTYINVCNIVSPAVLAFGSILNKLSKDSI